MMRPTEHLICLLCLLYIFESVSGKSILPQLIKRVKPAVTTIDVFDEARMRLESGSGFFISKDLVVTSRHVFYKPPSIQDKNRPRARSHYANVRTNDRMRPREYAVRSVVFDDAESDIIVLQVLDAEDQESVVLAKDPIEEGEDIFVVSSPYGLEGVVTTGIVSAVHNDIDLQISASIGKGSSGAPVFNYEGEVVGVVNGYLNVGQNMNFAISAKRLRQLLSRIIPLPGEVQQLGSGGTEGEPQLVRLTLEEWVQKQENATNAHASSTALFNVKKFFWNLRELTTNIFSPNSNSQFDTTESQTLQEGNAKNRKTDSTRKNDEL